MLFWIIGEKKTIRAKNLKCYSSYKSQPKPLLLVFLNGPPKILEFLKLEILTYKFFINTTPNAIENFKMLLLLQIAVEFFFKLSLNLPNGPPKSTLVIFYILTFQFLMIFFRQFEIHHYTIWKKKHRKNQLSGNQWSSGKKRKFWTRGF